MPATKPNKHAQCFSPTWACFHEENNSHIQHLKQCSDLHVQIIYLSSSLKIFVLLNSLMDKMSQGILSVTIPFKRFPLFVNFYNLLPLNYSNGTQFEIKACESLYNS